MSPRTPIQTAVVVIAAAAAITQSALAGVINADPKNQLPFTQAVAQADHGQLPGATANADPKNEWPFTRPVAVAINHTAQVATLNADPKNEWPFTRRTVPSRQLAFSGPLNADPKNQWPFTRHLDANATVAGGSGFNWTDSSIGLAAGIGIALAGGAALSFGRKSRPLRTS